MNNSSPFLKWLERVENYCAYVSSFVILFILVATVADAGGRYLINQPITGVLELVTLLLPSVGFLSLAYVQRLGGHIAITLVTERLSPKLRRGLETGTMIATLLIMGLVTWASAAEALKLWRLNEGTSGMVFYPLGPFMMAIPLGIALFCIRLFCQLIGSSPPSSEGGHGMTKEQEGGANP